MSHIKLDANDVLKAFRVWFAGLTQQQRVSLIRGHQQTFHAVLDGLHGDERDTDLLDAMLVTVQEERAS